MFIIFINKPHFLSWMKKKYQWDKAEFIIIQMNKLLLRKALQWINSVTFKYEKKEILTASVQT